MYFTDESGGNVCWCCMYVSSYAIVFMLCCSWRNCSDRVVMLEASVETYKRKLENLGDLKRQMKLLEENNMTYMQNTVSLEEELRKANAARAQLETYKRQVSDTQSRVRNPKIPLRLHSLLRRWAAPLLGAWNKQHSATKSGIVPFPQWATCCGIVHVTDWL